MRASGFKMSIALAASLVSSLGALQAPFAQAASKSTLEKNKALVIAFYDLAANKRKPAEAVKLYTDGRYIQHNPYAADGAEAFVKFFTDFGAKNPDASITFKRVIAEGDLVVTHGHWKKSKDDRGSAVADIFRISNGKIAEHWDVIQPIPEKSANPNTMF